MKELAGLPQDALEHIRDVMDRKANAKVSIDLKDGRIHHVSVTHHYRTVDNRPSNVENLVESAGENL